MWSTNARLWVRVYLSHNELYAQPSDFMWPTFSSSCQEHGLPIPSITILFWKISKIIVVGEPICYMLPCNKHINKFDIYILPVILMFDINRRMVWKIHWRAPVMRSASGTPKVGTSIYCMQVHKQGKVYTWYISVFQLENKRGRMPGRALCEQWAREGTFYRKQVLKFVKKAHFCCIFFAHFWYI